MYGLILSELRKYVEARRGRDAWNRLLEAAELQGTIYFPNRAYSDEEVTGILDEIAQEGRTTVNWVLEDFGEFIAADLIEHTEETIHRVIRSTDPGAKPPKLECRTAGRDEIVILYRSARRMCAFAKGIVRGLAACFREEVRIAEPTCMHDGAPYCEIFVQVVRREGAR